MLGYIGLYRGMDHEICSGSYYLPTAVCLFQRAFSFARRVGLALEFRA